MNSSLDSMTASSTSVSAVDRAARNRSMFNDSEWQKTVERKQESETRPDKTALY